MFLIQNKVNNKTQSTIWASSQQYGVYYTRKKFFGAYKFKTSMSFQHSVDILGKKGKANNK